MNAMTGPVSMTAGLGQWTASHIQDYTGSLSVEPSSLSLWSVHNGHVAIIDIEFTITFLGRAMKCLSMLVRGSVKLLEVRYRVLLSYGRVDLTSVP